MRDESEVTTSVADIYGEPTEVVHVRLVDARGQEREVTLTLDAADELATQLALAVVS